MMLVAVVILVFVVPVVAVEIGLSVWRKRARVGRGYILCSFVLRTLAYSPGVLGAGHGAMPMPLLAAITFAAFSSNSSVGLFSGIPLCVVGSVIGLLTVIGHWSTLAPEKTARARSSRRR
jgi:hypothetical protein